MQEYQVEVVVHMQVLVKVLAEDEVSARNQAGMTTRDNIEVNGDLIDLTITDTYIIE